MKYEEEYWLAIRCKACAQIVPSKEVPLIYIRSAPDDLLYWRDCQPCTKCGIIGRESAIIGSYRESDKSFLEHE